ncbi:MAG TPA: hypothetical protein VME24_05570 [Alphaproteobacteria bacterium]|nr:hypothetical protein [Alphaproteobacteria bacterium]
MFLKILAWFCKVAAILFWLVLTLYKSSDVARPLGGVGSGAPEFLEIAILSAYFVLVILPNRWLVFSPVAFVISLLIALIPLFLLLGSMGWSNLSVVAPLIVYFGLLPSSLVLSFWRRRKGEKIGYV